jgi:hypothetical protein
MVGRLVNVDVSRTMIASHFFVGSNVTPVIMWFMSGFPGTG